MQILLYRLSHIQLYTSLFKGSAQLASILAKLKIYNNNSNNRNNNNENNNNNNF